MTPPGQVRLRSLAPSPHVTEHEEKLLHSDHTGQGPASQETVSTLSPGQSSPLHDRVRDIVPLPHVTEHEP